MAIVHDTLDRYRNNVLRRKTVKAIKDNTGKDGTFEVVRDENAIIRITMHTDTDSVIVTVMKPALSKTGRKVWSWYKYEYINNEFIKQPKHGLYPYEWLKV